jgi:hypothetical protein
MHTKESLFVVRVRVRQCLSTVATNGPIFYLAGDI